MTAQDIKHIRILFGAGLALLIVVCVVALLLPCPTVSQGFPFQVLLSLSGAMVAAGIPGTIEVKLSTNAGVAVRAGGAIAAFILLFWLDPLLPGKTRLENTFANASCQGYVPRGEIRKQDLPTGLNPEDVGRISSQDALGRPTHFSINYKFQPSPGIRDWTQVKPGVWIERYPDPNVFAAFQEKGRTTLDGCPGSVLLRTSSQGADVFIPDKGCKLMWVRFRQLDSQEWQWFGEMQDVL